MVRFGLMVSTGMRMSRAGQREHDRHDVDPAYRVHRRENAVTGGTEAARNSRLRRVRAYAPCLQSRP